MFHFISAVVSPVLWDTHSWLLLSGVGGLHDIINKQIVIILTDVAILFIISGIFTSQVSVLLKKMIKIMAACYLLGFVPNTHFLTSGESRCSSAALQCCIIMLFCHIFCLHQIIAATCYRDLAVLIILQLAAVNIEELFKAEGPGISLRFGGGRNGT